MSASIFKRANDSDDDNCLHFDATLSQDASSEDDGASPSQFLLLSGVVRDNSLLLTLSTVTKGDNAEVPIADDDDNNDEDDDNNDDDDADNNDNNDGCDVFFEISVVAEGDDTPFEYFDDASSTYNACDVFLEVAIVASGIETPLIRPDNDDNVSDELKINEQLRRWRRK